MRLLGFVLAFGRLDDPQQSVLNKGTPTVTMTVNIAVTMTVVTMTVTAVVTKTDSNWYLTLQLRGCDSESGSAYLYHDQLRVNECRE